VLAIGISGVAYADTGVILGYGAVYQLADGSSRVHQGLDLPAGEGEDAHSMADGEVTFAGKVPADGGGQVFAVTVKMADGLLVTESPLESVDVAKGAQVARGDTLGAIACDGDCSSSVPHVHLSARRDGVYIDPAFLNVVDASPQPLAETPAKTVSGASQSSAADVGHAGEAIGAASTSASVARLSDSCSAPRTIPHPATSVQTKVRAPSISPAASVRDQVAKSSGVTERSTTDESSAWSPQLGSHMALAGFIGSFSTALAGARATTCTLAVALAAGLFMCRRNILSVSGEGL